MRTFFSVTPVYFHLSNMYSIPKLIRFPSSRSRKQGSWSHHSQHPAVSDEFPHIKGKGERKGSAAHTLAIMVIEELRKCWATITSAERNATSFEKNLATISDPSCNVAVMLFNFPSFLESESGCDFTSFHWNRHLLQSLPMPLSCFRFLIRNQIPCSSSLMVPATSTTLTQPNGRVPRTSANFASIRRFSDFLLRLSETFDK